MVQSKELFVQWKGIQNKLPLFTKVILLLNFISRLKPDKVLLQRQLIRLITFLIWGVFITFFRKSVQITISGICPHGKHSSIGGRKKRNITTFGMNNIFQLMASYDKLWHFLLFLRWWPVYDIHSFSIYVYGRYSDLDFRNLPELHW